MEPLEDVEALVNEQRRQIGTRVSLGLIELDRRGEYADMDAAVRADKRMPSRRYRHVGVIREHDEFGRRAGVPNQEGLVPGE